MVLTASVFEQDISLLYMDDGIYQLLGEQQTESRHQKKADAAISALQFYDVDKVFVCSQSLTERGLDEKDLSEALKLTQSDLLTKTAISELIAKQDQILSF